MRETNEFIFRSALDLLPLKKGMKLIDAVREAEEAWETLRLVREKRSQASEICRGAAALAAMSAICTSRRFVRATDTTFDTHTDLTWSDPLGNDSLTVEGADKAIAACRAGGFNDWRKPTLDELETIVDRNLHNPAIDTKAFPGTKSGWYWTSTECAWSKDENGVASYF